jgi:hypothetical protein
MSRARAAAVLAGLAPGTAVEYRATLTEPDGTRVSSTTRTIVVAPPPLDTAVVHYWRADRDYANWGLHLWGDAVAPEAKEPNIAWTDPWDVARVDADGWGRYEIPLVDDAEAVNFIMHKPGGDEVPVSRGPAATGRSSRSTRPRSG